MTKVGHQAVEEMHCRIMHDRLQDNEPKDLANNESNFFLSQFVVFEIRNAGETTLITKERIVENMTLKNTK